MIGAVLSETHGTSTLFEFMHPVFRTPEARFLLGTDGKPFLSVKMGAYDALLPLSSVVREFNLSGTADAALLDTVIAGLKYVKTIRPGDSIPRELLDGSASWRVEDEHMEIAQGRLNLQIFSLLSGNERVVTDPNEILQLVGDPMVVTKVTAGLPQIAQKLDLAPGNIKDVTARIDRLARELVYIEALRERFQSVKQLQGKIASFRRVYRNDKTIDEELTRINNLLLRPLDLFSRSFEEVDAHSGEIITTLRNLERQITYIREARDKLHTRLMLWDDILKKWDRATMEISQASEGIIKEIYRFLAQNYLSGKSWNDR